MKPLYTTIKVLLFAGIMGVGLSSCEDFMSTSSNRLTLADDNLIDSSNDSVYSILGILNQVQKISDRYVLFGELRGDLMDVTENSESYLRDLSQFNVNPATSPFADVRDFYSVINNCNLFIQRVDTNIVDRTNKPFVKELAVAKSIRAWTYMQIVLNYGKAVYFNKPLLTVTDTEESFPELGPEAIIDSLIADLITTNPLAPTKLPAYGTINEVQSKYLFINTKFLMGDLYMWKASFTKSLSDYEEAAKYYAKLIDEGAYIINPNVNVRWNNDFFMVFSDYWLESLISTSNNSELISIAKLSGNIYEGTPSQVSQLASSYKLTSSKAMDEIFAAQSYCFYDPVTSSAKYYPGDLRAKVAVKSNLDEKMTITKFQKFNVNFYRVALLYLRYAEAVNRTGKPGLAFAILKYGLSSTVLKDVKKVPAADIANNPEYVIPFLNDKFKDNSGIHNRGCGSTNYNVNYVIPDYTRFSPVVVKDINGNPLIGSNGSDSVKFMPTTVPDLLALAKMDSVLYVENAISDELALETGFEGNRFQDLMRISNHRNDTEYLAKKVAAKHSNYNAIFTRLKDKNNWYLPVK